jgi:hypothetical protein
MLQRDQHIKRVSDPLHLTFIRFHATTFSIRTTSTSATDVSSNMSSQMLPEQFYISEWNVHIKKVPVFGSV